MTHEELARRRPLWAAMSDLFLDTEVRWEVPGLARRCVESGYDDEALERIFWVEVFPEASGNLLQVAGEWAVLTLDKAALVRRANRDQVPWLARRTLGWMVQDEWRAAREVTSWLRPLGAPEREAWTQALSLLGHRFFSEPHEESWVASAERLAALGPFGREAWARYEPLCRSMLLRNETGGDARAARVRAQLAP